MTECVIKMEQHLTQQMVAIGVRVQVKILFVALFPELVLQVYSTTSF